MVLDNKFGEEFVLREEMSMIFVYWFAILYIRYELDRILEEYCCNNVHTFCRITFKVCGGWYGVSTGLAAIWADGRVIGKTTSKTTNETAGEITGETTGSTADKTDSGATGGTIIGVDGIIADRVTGKATGRAASKTISGAAGGTAGEATGGVGIIEVWTNVTMI